MGKARALWPQRCHQGMSTQSTCSHVQMDCWVQMASNPQSLVCVVNSRGYDIPISSPSAVDDIRIRAAVERAWHMTDSHSQILAFTFSQRSFQLFKFFSPRSDAISINSRPHTLDHKPIQQRKCGESGCQSPSPTHTRWSTTLSSKARWQRPIPSEKGTT